MSERRSVVGQLTLGLLLVGLIGGAVLAVVMVVDVDRWFERHLLPTLGASAEMQFRYFLMSLFTLTIAALVLAARSVVARSLAPLHAGVGEIEQAIDARRRYRLDVAALPAEVARYGAAINALIDQLEKVAIRREAFAAEVAHELKNPMAVLLLELEAIGSKQSRRLQVDVRRMSRLIDQLLVMAQLEAHATAPVKSTLIDLGELASELVQSMRPVAAGEGRYLALALNDHAPVRGRRELVWAATRNMVENALRVTPLDGVVTVSVGPGARLAVADGGDGISKAELVRMSTPFAQARHPSANGAGLGLAIIDEVARLHGGTLDCDPERKEIILTLAPVQNGACLSNQYLNLD